MRRGWVPTAEFRRQQAARRQRALELALSPMGLWDKVFGGGELARDLAQPLVPKETPTMELEEYLSRRAGEAQVLAGELKRWVGPGAETNAHRAKQRKEAELRLSSHHGETRREAARMVTEASTPHLTARSIGTRLNAEQLAEAQLTAMQYRDAPRQQQAQLAAEAAGLIRAGELGLGLAKARAVEAIGYLDPELQATIANLDPIRSEAQKALERLGMLNDAVEVDHMRDRIAAGIGETRDELSVMDWAFNRGLNRNDVRPFVEQVAAGAYSSTPADANGQSATELAPAAPSASPERSTRELAFGPPPAQEPNDGSLAFGPPPRAASGE